MKSKLPSAEKFEAWVFAPQGTFSSHFVGIHLEEVLPAIRKHGMYFTQDTVADIFKKIKSPTNSIEMDGFLSDCEKIKLEKELALAQPKVYDKVINSSLLGN